MVQSQRLKITFDTMGVVIADPPVALLLILF